VVQIDPQKHFFSEENLKAMLNCCTSFSTIRNLRMCCENYNSLSLSFMLFCIASGLAFFFLFHGNMLTDLTLSVVFLIFASIIFTVLSPSTDRPKMIKLINILDINYL
jgi:archaellum biogenesis protein FlaJ (TadC family)